MTNRERYILLNLVSEIGSACVRRLLDACGSLERVCAAQAPELQRAGGISPAVAARIVSGCRNERLLQEELARAAQADVEIVTLEDAAYPEWLRTISDPPLALYIRGRLLECDHIAVGIVGSRRASLYGLQCAERLSYDLALRGITIISGLARGIDAAAHEGALNAGGRTLAVLGCGLAQMYPPEHESLAKQVTDHGAVLSEYPMQMPPLPHHFPRRNRIISGLSRGVVVVEASQRSGALITADCALEQGREVFAIPGPITATTSQGTHHLLKQGARMVTSVEDILDELGLTPQPAAHVAVSTTEHQRIELTDREAKIVACLSEREPSYVDHIATASGLAMAEVSALLMRLELKRTVRQLPGKRFVRC